uniref:Secreted peptide n=1 Tax=Arundo donax TaxID=35708 RepID=A0A0A9BY24_ARUDO
MQRWHMVPFVVVTAAFSILPPPPPPPPLSLSLSHVCVRVCMCCSSCSSHSSCILPSKGLFGSSSFIPNFCALLAISCHQ